METSQREDLLKSYARRKVSLGHYEVFDQEPFAIYVRSTRKVNHILHFLISVVTVGFWLPIWVIMSLPTKKAFRISIDEQGVISERRWN
jgi:hypothetical protein